MKDKCNLPRVTKHTFTDIEIKGGSVAYAIDLANPTQGNYIISAVLNNAWCVTREEAGTEWLRAGDYHNAMMNELYIRDNETEIERDIQVKLYIPEGGEDMVA